ncbi:MAG: hypothetical protein MZW92_48415 [Comamonadaceae bacterium]|nr:hypothetical protein [Comamonadaceae bacterium]
MPESPALALAPRAWTMTHAYLGPAWPDEAVRKALDWAGLDYEALADDAALVERTARLLAGDCIVGWHQGCMEWGPRALGARSILASPISPQMQQRLNDLKDREDFRPVAPAVLHEAFADWFEPAAANGGDAPFMLFTFQTKPRSSAGSRRPATATAARVQTVHAATNPRFHALISAFAARTGVPVLVNTSFNVRGQPIVCSPQDALEAFFATPLDALVIGNCIVVKARAKAVLEAGA